MERSVSRLPRPRPSAHGRKPLQGSAFLGSRALPPRQNTFGMRNRMDERYDFVRAATDGRHHYIRNYTPHRVFQHGAYEWLAKGYQSWEREYLAGRLEAVQSRFFVGRRPFEELYDLRDDPDQVTNLAGDPRYSQRLAAAREALDRHLLAINDNGFIPERMDIEGFERSRDRTAYPLERVIAIAILARLEDEPNSTPVRLQALNALTFLGEQARPVLGVVERAAGGDDEVLRNAGRYLAAVLTGRYEPSYPVFDLEWFRRKYQRS